MSRRGHGDQIEPLEITNPDRTWVVAELERLYAEWLAWQQEVEKIVDQPYDRRTQADVLADGEDMMHRHSVLQAKTLTFLNNNVRGHGFIRGFDGQGIDRTDLRLRIRVKHRLQQLDVLRASLQYAKHGSSSLEILTAYLRAAADASTQGEEYAMGAEVEQRLGLSPLRGTAILQELDTAGLIAMAQADNALAYYRLTVKGLALKDQLAAVEPIVRQREAAIDASPGPADEKQAAKFRLRDELGKAVIRRGVDWTIDHVGEIWHQVQVAYSWLRAIAGGKG